MLHYSAMENDLKGMKVPQAPPISPTQETDSSVRGPERDRGLEAAQRIAEGMAKKYRDDPDWEVPY